MADTGPSLQSFALGPGFATVRADWPREFRAYLDLAPVIRFHYLHEEACDG